MSDLDERRRKEVLAWKTYEKRKKSIRDHLPRIILFFVILIVVESVWVPFALDHFDTEFSQRLNYSVLLLLAYFAPALVANARKHHQQLAIGVLNFLTGWTVIGWIGALVWACTAVQKKVESVTPC